MASPDRIEQQLKSTPLTSLRESQIRTLQAFLTSLGYPPGRIDGQWGPLTMGAWTRFAQANNINPADVPSEVWYGASTGQHAYARGGGGKPEAYRPPAPAAAPSPPSGTAAAPGATPAAAAPATVPQPAVSSSDEEQRIRERYPSFAVWLDHPEIGQLLRQSIGANGDPAWTPEELAARVQQTEFWRTTQASRRTWDRDYFTDPATMEAKIQAEQVELQNLAGTYGIFVEPGQTRDFAISILRDGLTQAQVLRQLGQQARNQGLYLSRKDPNAQNGGLGGGLAATFQQLQKQARAMHLTYSDDQLREWSIRILEGQDSMEGVQGLFRSQAKSAYSHLADQIDQGMTVEDYFTPLKNFVARSLEIDGSAIDLTNGKWAELTQLVDDKGTVRPMTYSEATRWVRSQDEWKATREGSEQMYGALNGLGRALGMV